MPGLPGPSWLVWLAPFGLLAAAWHGVSPVPARSRRATDGQHLTESSPPSAALAHRPGRGTRRRRFFLGWLAGLVHFLISLHWLTTIALAPLWASLLGWFALCAYLSLWFGLFTWLAGSLTGPSSVPNPLSANPASTLSRFRHLGRALWLAAFWLAAETGRDHLFGGFNWNGYYAALIDQPLFSQAADLSSALALSALPVFVAALVWGVVATVRSRQKITRESLPLAELGVLILLVLGLFFHARHQPTAPENALSFRALALQPLLSQERKWDPASHEATHALYSRLRDAGLAEAAAADARDNLPPRVPAVDLLLLPESAYTHTVVRFTDGTIPPEYEMTPVGQTRPQRVIQPSPALLNHLRQGQFTAISGVNIEEVQPDTDHPNSRSFNSLLRIAANGEFQTYDKRHLVPFGEYLPLRPLFFFLDDLIPWNFSSGAANQQLDLLARDASGQPRPLPTACLICFEDTVPRVARASIRANPARTLQLNATNDGWFPELAARQHLAHARWRAIELRRPLLRAGNSGGTAAIDATGSLQDPLNPQRRQLLTRPGATALDHPGALLANLALPDPDHPPTTLYQRWGNWLGGLSVGITLVTMINLRIARLCGSPH